MQRSRIKHAYAVKLAVLFLGYLTVPHFVYVQYQQSSLGIGLAYYSILLFCVYLSTGRLSMTAIQWGILSLAAASTGMSSAGDLERQIFSLLVMAMIFISTNNFFKDLSIRDDLEVRWVIRLTFYVLLVVGIVGKISRIDFGNYAQGITVLPFYEPSHYALTFGPIACAYMFQVRKWKRVGVACIVLLLALWYPNLTLLAVAVLMLLVIARAWAIMAVAILLSMVLSYIGTQRIERLPQYDYFAGRLGGWDERENLTYLVYLQGWEQAAIAITESHGLGVGFQRFGNETAGEAADRIEARYGVPVSRKDGSNLGAKLVGEFGYVGIALCAGMIFFSGYSFIKLRALFFSRRPRGQYVDAVFLACSCLFIIEIIFRGLAYFNPMLYLYCFGIGRLTGRAWRSGTRKAQQRNAAIRENDQEVSIPSVLTANGVSGRPGQQIPAE